MIEIPEAITISRQLNETLTGKKIKACIRGNTPHKFAFYSYSPEEYAAILYEKTIGGAEEYGAQILLYTDPGYAVVLGTGGERILYHPNEGSLPKKHHFLLQFYDGSYLTVSVQGWGSALLLPKEEIGHHQLAGPRKTHSLSEAFTEEFFLGLFEPLEGEDARSIKFFLISQPGVWGMGNGYLQDILYRAKIHPRRRAAQMTRDERLAIHRSIQEILRQAVDLNGRDTERDLFNQPGRYVRVLDSRKVSQPCQECGTPIVKESFLGGAVYFCPSCQI